MLQRPIETAPFIRPYPVKRWWITSECIAIQKERYGDFTAREPGWSPVSLSRTQSITLTPS